MQIYLRRQPLFFSVLLAVVLPAIAKPVWSQEAESPDITIEVVVEALAAPTDFSVTQNGEVVFIAERGAGQIRRVQGNVDEVVVKGIESDGQFAETLAVHAISANQVLLGATGFSSVQKSLCLFDVSAKELPLRFADQQLKHSRHYESSLKRIKAFNVLGVIRQQRGLAIACQFGKAPPTVCDVHLKKGKLERLVENEFDAKTANLSTLAVDQIGGYLVAITQDKPRQIVFYQAEGKSLQSFAIELENIVSMSFSPAHNRLFALVNGANDDAASGSEGDGIYEIFTESEACKSRFVIAMKHPQQLKFDALGTGWVLCRSDADGRGLLKKVNNLDVSPTILQTKEPGSNED